MTNVWKNISTFRNPDHTKKAIVNVDGSRCCYFVDYFVNDAHVDTIAYPGKSLYYVENCAENYTLGILNVSETA